MATGGDSEGSISYMDSDGGGGDDGDGQDDDGSEKISPGAAHGVVSSKLKTQTFSDQDKEHGNALEQFPVHRAWEEVLFKIKHVDDSDEINIFKKRINPRLQFVLISDKEKRRFEERLQKKMSIHCSDLKKGIIHIKLICTLLHKEEVIDVINEELNDYMVSELNFQSEQSFYSFLKSADGARLQDCNVGVFFLKSAEKHIVVGSNQNVKWIEERVRTHINKQTNPVTGICYDSGKKCYILRREYDSDTVCYLHWMKLNKQCPTATHVELYVDKGIIEITAKTENDVLDASQVIEETLAKTMKEKLDFDEFQLLFFQEENVQLSVQIKLSKLPAYLQVTSHHASLWSTKTEKIKEAKDAVFQSFSHLNSGTNSKYKAEINQNIDLAKKKIKLFQTGDTTCMIMYLKEKEEYAFTIQRLLAPGKSKKLNAHLVPYLMASGDQESLGKAFPDAIFEFDAGNNTVTITGDQVVVKDVLKEIEALIKNVTSKCLHEVSPAKKELLIRPHVSTYVTKELGCQYLLFIEDQDGFHCVGHRENLKEIEEKLRTKCFKEEFIKNEFLNTDEGQQFQNEHLDSIYIQKSKDECLVTYLENKEEAVKQFLQKSLENRIFQTTCLSVVSDFFKSYGQNILRDAEEKFKLKITIDKGIMVFKGKYADGKAARKYLKEMIKASSQNLKHTELVKKHLQSENFKKDLDEIAGRQKCCWNVKLQKDEHNIDSAKLIKTGIKNLASWAIYKSSVSVVEADFQAAKFDVVIIPVDDKMCGESIFKSDGSIEDYNQHYNLTIAQKQNLGSVHSWKSPEMDQKIVFIVCLETTTSKTKGQQQQLITEDDFYSALSAVFRDQPKDFTQHLGFKVPVVTDDEMHSWRRNIVAKLLERLMVQGMHLYLCVKNEDQSTIDCVEESLLSYPETRRIVSHETDIFSSGTEVKITETSFLDLGAECIILAVSKNLDFEKGKLSKYVNSLSGGVLQKQFPQGSHFRSEGELQIVTEVGSLQNKGVKLVIVGFLPMWRGTICLEILKRFVIECLMKSDKHGCKTVAFPALGTGNLLYPPRDVAKVMMDGIYQYVQEYISCQLHEVYISVPIFEKDDSMLQIFKYQQSCRMQCIGDSVEDQKQEVLTAQGSRLRYEIQAVIPVQRKRAEFVNVHFKTDTHSVSMLDNWTLNVPCAKQNGLKEAVDYMRAECDERCITSVYVHCSKDLLFPIYEQAATIIETLHNFAQNYKYLSNVTIVAQDEAGFDNIKDQILMKKEPKWFFRSLLSSGEDVITRLEWIADIDSIQECYVQLQLIGEDPDKIESARKEITEYLSQSCEEVLVHHEKDIDPVSVVLNPGIVEYFQHHRDKFTSWKRTISHHFKLQVEEENGHTQIHAIGAFDDLMRFEVYLENNFPNIPCTNLPQGLDCEENHYNENDDDDEDVFVQVPINEEQKPVFLEMFSKEITSLSQKDIVREIKSDTGNIYFGCKRERKAFVKSKFLLMRKQFMEMTVSLVPIMSSEHKKFAKKLFDYNNPQIKELKQTDNVLVIRGTNKKDVENVEKAIKFLKTYRFGTVLVLIYTFDILKTNVDCIVTATDQGLSNSKGLSMIIKETCGEMFIQGCGQSLKKDGVVPVTKCRAIEAKGQRFKHVIHVNGPIKFITKENEHELDHLKQIEQSTSNCIEEAHTLQAKSIAFPFICSGLAGFELKKCAQQYIRALQNSRSKSIEVHFVDIDERKVLDVQETFTHFFQEKANIEPIIIFSSQTKQEIKFSLIDSNRFFVSDRCHGIVVIANKPQTKNAISIEEWMQLKEHGLDIYIKTQSEETQIADAKPLAGDLRCKFLLYAVQPSSRKDTERDYRILMRNIMIKATELNLESIAIPMIFKENNDQEIQQSCNGIVDGIMSQASKSSSLDISLYSLQDRVLIQMNYILLQKRQEYSGCKRHETIV